MALRTEGRTLDTAKPADRLRQSLETRGYGRCGRKTSLSIRSEEKRPTGLEGYGGR